MKLIRLKQAAEMLGVCGKTLRNWERQGKIKAHRTIGNQRRYDLAEIQRLQNGGKK